MEAFSVAESLSKYFNCPAEEFKFTHLMLNHRVQWYMMYCMLSKIQRNETQTLDDMWAMYQLMFTVHSSVEERELISQLSYEVKVVSDAIHADHEAFVPMMTDLENARKENYEIFGEKLKVFAKRYHEHTIFEEKEMLPACHALPSDKREAVTRAFKDHFKSQPDSAWLILSMRDVASFSGDQNIWELSMPWFFRTIIAPFLCLNGTYVKYTTLFPPEDTSAWLSKYAIMIT